MEKDPCVNKTASFFKPAAESVFSLSSGQVCSAFVTEPVTFITDSTALPHVLEKACEQLVQC